MTQFIPRRLFEDDEPKKIVRCNGAVTEDLNERFKAMARRRGKTAEDFIGWLLMTKVEPQLRQMELDEEAERLRKQFGDNWLDVLRQANPTVD